MNPNLKIVKTTHAHTPKINWVVLAAVLSVVVVFAMGLAMDQIYLGVMGGVFSSLLWIVAFTVYYVYLKVRKTNPPA